MKPGQWSYGQTKILSVLGFILISTSLINAERQSFERAENRTFSINYDEDSFWKDGEPFRYVSGSLHYFRSPHETWRERLRTLRSAGLNAVSTYVEWSFHEPEKGVFRWEDDYDLINFIRIAQEEDLYVILRIGPYICAERDMGGLPYWLLSFYPDIKLRSDDVDYKKEVSIWFAELLSRVEPLLYGNNGPIIMMQLENEYGLYDACDHDYMKWLAELVHFWVQDAAVYFTTDKAEITSLTCGAAPGAYSTIDFGTAANIPAAWEAMRQVSPRGPLVNSEFYTGWITHWGESSARVSETAIVTALETMLQNNANVNFYMFHGGTNFEYSAGSSPDPFAPAITSYDYDAPMTEAGDPTSKYFAIRDVLLRYLPEPPYPPPAVKSKWSMGAPLTVEPVFSLMSAEGRKRFALQRRYSQLPPTLESIGQRAGITLYETHLPASRGDIELLTLEDLRDRALIYLDWHFVGALSRMNNIFSFPVLLDQGIFIQIIVESFGRINIGSGLNDFKGIVGNVTIGSQDVLLWDVTRFPLESVDDMTPATDELDVTSEGSLTGGPVFYSAKFQVPPGEVLDTYLDVTGWSKGFAWVNGRHLGRYWPVEGPQVTLYTPGAYLKPYPEENSVVLLELQRAADNQTVSFIDYPIGI